MFTTNVVYAHSVALSFKAEVFSCSLLAIPEAYERKNLQHWKHWNLNQILCTFKKVILLNHTATLMSRLTKIMLLMDDVEWSEKFAEDKAS